MILLERKHVGVAVFNSRKCIKVNLARSDFGQTNSYATFVSSNSFGIQITYQYVTVIRVLSPGSNTLWAKSLPMEISYWVVLHI